MGLIYNKYSIWSECPLCFNLDLIENHIEIDDKEYLCDECYEECNGNQKG